MSAETNNNDVHRVKRIAVAGLGSGGIRALSALALLPAADKLHLFAIDTDRETLAASPLPGTGQLLLGEQWRKGRGCGGDPLKGEQAISLARGELERTFRDFDYLIILGGLGGGFATGAVNIMARLRTPTLLLLTLPFSWEGHAKWKLADEAVTNLVEQGACAFLLPNDLLFSTLSPETPAREAFALADTELARAVTATAELLGSQSIIPADYSDLSEILTGKKSFASIGVGIAQLNEATNAGELALDRMLTAPLLGGIGKLREADVVLLSILGDPTLSIAQLQQSAAAAGKCCGDTPELVVAVNTSPEYAGCIMMTAMAVKYSDRGKTVRKRRHTVQADSLFDSVAPAPHGEPVQPTLPLELPTVAKGIFFNSAPTIYNGEDIDTPTFRRREIPIDPGE